MSDTPRTDALLLKINEGRVYKDHGPVTNLAFELEREVAALRDACQVALDEFAIGNFNAARRQKAVEFIRATLGREHSSAGGEIGGWTSVTDRMPPLDTECLVWARESWRGSDAFGVSVDVWREQHEAPLGFSSATIPIGPGWDEHDNYEEVTHWMPLPAAPTVHRACTCHPDDDPPRPCPQKFALTECRLADVKPEDLPFAPSERKP